MEEEDRKGRWRRLMEPEMLIASSAVVIGVCALVVSLVQVQLMRAEQHAAVWPVVQVARTYQQGSEAGVIVLNPGIGPAIIRDVRVDVDGTPARSWREALALLLADRQPGGLSRSAISGRIIPAGESVVTVRVTDAEAADLMRENMHRVGMRVCYCSVYDQCWSVGASFVPDQPQEDPVPVDGCHPGETSFLD